MELAVGFCLWARIEQRDRRARDHSLHRHRSLIVINYSKGCFPYTVIPNNYNKQRFSVTSVKNSTILR